jgi:hypothetical protein
VSTPVSMRPAGANDSRPSRPIFFQTPGGASAFALRCAVHESPTRTARALEFVQNAFQAKEGGKVFLFESAAPSDDYVVRELTPSEVGRRQQAGMRAAIAALYERAEQELKASAAAKTSTFRCMHLKWARELQGQARDIELQLVVAFARKCDEEEPITSSERDSRVELSL